MAAKDPADFDDEEWDDPTPPDNCGHDRKKDRQPPAKTSKKPRKG
jgi:hypothetical protein